MGTAELQRRVVVPRGKTGGETALIEFRVVCVCICTCVSLCVEELWAMFHVALLCDLE